MGVKVSVILIRENAEQLTGGGCCTALQSDGPMPQTDALFADARASRQHMGLLHRTIREFFPAEKGVPVEVLTVDPRNQLYLLLRLWWDVARYRPPLGQALRTAVQWFSLPAVIINGRVISRQGKPVDPDSVCHAIEMQLRGRRPEPIVRP
jgi:hypothetical protein